MKRTVNIKVLEPEILLFSCKYWSLGIKKYEAYYGDYPFGRNAKDFFDVYKEVIKKEVIYNGGANKIIQLIGGLLTKNEDIELALWKEQKLMKLLKILIRKT